MYDDCNASARADLLNSDTKFTRHIVLTWNKNVNNHCYCSKTGDILGVLSLRHPQFLTNNISKILFKNWGCLRDRTPKISPVFEQ